MTYSELSIMHVSAWRGISFPIGIHQNVSSLEYKLYKQFFFFLKLIAVTCVVLQLNPFMFYKL